MRDCGKDVPLAKLPGGDLVSAGIEALRRGEFTVEALLVCVGERRLRRTGVDVPETPGRPSEPELALYEAVCAAGGPRGAHSRYNALIRRLTSCERALEMFGARAR